MAENTNKYLDLAGLQLYDTSIKNYIDTEDAKSIKFAKISTDGNTLLLYKSKDASATSKEESADFRLPMGSAALKALVKNLGAAVGATYTDSPEGFSVTFTGDIASNKNVVAAVQAVNDHIGTLGSLTTTNKTNIVAAINELVQAIADLDVNEFALTEDNSDVISIYGIKEENGKIAKGASKIDLAKIAKTGAAADASTTAITDGKAESTILYKAGDVQGVLEAIARNLNNLKDESKVTVEKQETAEKDYFATYVIKQNNTQVGEKINIPKDYLVKEASVKTVTVADQPYEGAEVGDKYIDFVINVKAGATDESHIYIPVDELMKAITGGTNAETTVAISASNEITVTINKIAASKIAYDNTSSGSSVEESVQAALTRIDGEDTVPGSIKKAVKDGIEALDTTSDVGMVTHTAGTGTGATKTADETTIIGSMAEVNGVIKAGTADSVKFQSISGAEIANLFA